MIRYTENELLRIAKRFRNKKRKYLLVDPLQAKHIPVEPSKALDMFWELGRMVKSEYPEAGFVIGFAETATAVGMGVADELGDGCIYIHTTREDVDSVENWIEFKEEHSHAVEQKLAAGNIAKWISCNDTLVFVDDEISTGKTLINFVKQLRSHYPDVKNKNMIAASIINSVSDQKRNRLAEYGIKCISLLNLEEIDYSDKVEQIEIKEAEKLSNMTTECEIETLPITVHLRNPRTGVKAADYKADCVELADQVIDSLPGEKKRGRILVLGTEECMYPAVILGNRLEMEGAKVLTHSTTRSPIGVSITDDYPIRSGYKLDSFYDDDRDTYIYNLKKYDLVIIVTDSQGKALHGIQSIAAALEQEGNKEILLIRG